MVLDVAAEILEGAWVENDTERDKAIASAIDAHEKGQSHRRPWGLVDVGFYFQSGEVGTAIVAATMLPCGMDIPFPAVINTWRIKVPYNTPSGSATFAVRLVQPDAAMSSAALISTGGVPTLTSATAASGDALGNWAVTDVPARGYLVATLLTSSTLQAVELHLELRRT